MGALAWDAAKRSWRDGNGRLLTPRQIAKLRDDLAAEVASLIRQETETFLAGDIELAAWRRNVERFIAEGTGSGYAFGRGGLANMTDGDYDRLARLLSEQTDVFGRFVAEVDAGNLSGAQIAARAETYAGASVNAFEQAQHQAAIGDSAADWELPCYPADGETDCLANCRCAWDIVEDETGWTATWIAENDDRTCPGCTQRSEMYGPANPLRFPKPVDEQPGTMTGMAA